MQGSNEPTLASKLLAGFVLFCLLFVVVSCAVGGAARAIGDAVHPEAAATRRAEERATKAAADAERAAQGAAERARIGSMARESERVAVERKQREDERDAKEKECARELGFDACREIYRPTDAEISDQLRVVDRANQLASPYR